MSLAEDRPAAQDADVPAPVIAKQQAIASALETSLNLDQLVTREEARPSIARIARGYRRAAGSWQLDAAAVKEVSDTRLAGFIVARAQHVLTCTASLWSRMSMANAPDTKPDVLQKFEAEMAAGTTSTYRVAPNCVTLTDGAGQPATLGSPAAIEEALAFEGQFSKSVAPRLNVQGLTKSATYQANAAYFAREFSAGLAEDAGFAEALRRADLGLSANTQVFRFSMTNLSFFLRFDPGGPVRLIFIAPFSW